MDKLPKVKKYGRGERAIGRKFRWYASALGLAVGGGALVKEGEYEFALSAFSGAAGLAGYESHRDERSIGQESKGRRRIAVGLGAVAVALSLHGLWGKAQGISMPSPSVGSRDEITIDMTVPATSLPDNISSNTSVPETPSERVCDFVAPISAGDSAAIKEKQAALNLLGEEKYNVGKVDGVENENGPTENATNRWLEDNNLGDIFDNDACLALDAEEKVDGLLTDADLRSAVMAWEAASS